MVDRKISTVYLVAKVTGLPEKLVKKKYEMAKAVLKNHGYVPISPLDHVPTYSSWHRAMRICIPLMLSCDAYTLVDEAHTTPGGLFEDTIGGWVNMPKLYFDEFKK